REELKRIAAKNQADRDFVQQQTDFLALEPKLREIVKGTVKPANLTEADQFARLCRVKHHYTAALRIVDAAVAADPQAATKVAEADRWLVARIAVLAGTGQGADAPPGSERPQYRQMALQILQQHVREQGKLLEANREANCYTVQLNLRRLRTHNDLSSVRPPALDSLPADERREWQQLWADVDRLLQQAEGKR